LVLPAWLASRTKVPAPVTVRVLPLMLPAPVLLESMVKTTGLPEPPPVALRVIVSLGTKVIGEAGAVKLIVWLARSLVRPKVTEEAPPAEAVTV
jgi:hypothetical protein